MNKLIILIAGVSSLSVIAMGVYTWSSMGDVPMGGNGYIALILGVVFTVAVGIALMVLLFFSSRAGFDERAAGATRDKEPRGGR